MDGIDIAIESFKENLNDLKIRLSQLRKKGINAKIAELRIMQIPAKIKMAEITKENKDAQKIMVLLNAAKQEIEELEKESLNRQ